VSGGVRPGASYLGVPIEFHSSVGSTNDVALRREQEGAPEGLTIVTDEQTGGRGRHGRTWWDCPGDSLLFSLLLRPRLPLARLPLLGIAMACAVSEAGSEAAGASLAVKWPNDVLHAGRKLCGVLAEARSHANGRAGAGATGGAQVLVIGTGINVNQRAEDFPPEIRDRATSLRVVAGGRELDRGALLSEILVRFEAYRALAARDGGDALRGSLLHRLPAPGSRIAVQMAERRIEGTVEEILENGALVVRDDAGTRLAIAAGEIP
jgi:BirA family transcriptional regulator, biotin operon repressor / biotin---[acetyl-CoA-carboxylase] ligase